LIRELAVGQFGDGAYLEMAAPSMGAEDFSYVLQKVPGAMAFLASLRRRRPSARAPLHNPSMMVDEAVLPRGVAMHCAFATRFLERGWE
jgi:hippurate hydrolase